MITLDIRTTAWQQLVPIDAPVRAALTSTDMVDGALLIASPHTTCGVTINEGADPDVRRDIARFLGELVPHHYRHFEHAEGNSDAHVLTTLVGPSVMVPVAGGQLRLGRWQSLFLCEFDGPRSRQLWLTPLRSA